MKNDEEMNGVLLRLVSKNCRQAWLGTRPVFEMDVIDLLCSTNFRVSPLFHQKYDIVWSHEHLLSDLHPYHWRIVVDEATRLIGENGKLVVRTGEDHKFTLPLLKSFLGRKFDFDVSVFAEHKYKNNLWVVIFDIHRKNLEKYQSKTWTFAILTNGAKNDIVKQFLCSIRKHDEEKKHEIIICGPRNSEFDDFGVRYVNRDFREEFAEISKKKNMIAEMASNDNILIVHDRYKLDDSFFRGFDNYGYDFSFLTVKQYFENGTEFPAYCAVPAGLRWRHPIKIENYDFLYPHTYLNGGLLIFKTHLLRAIKFNENLFWNQMEDVEISKECMKEGILPRINYMSSATTIGIDEDKISSFKNENTYPNIYFNVWGIDYNLNQSSKSFFSKSGIKNFLKEVLKPSTYNKLKILYKTFRGNV